jgi:hypothetical protein
VVAGLGGCSLEHRPPKIRAKTDAQLSLLRSVGAIDGFDVVGKPETRVLEMDYEAYLRFVPSGSLTSAVRQLCADFVGGRVGALRVRPKSKCGSDGSFQSAEANDPTGVRCYVSNDLVFIENDQRAIELHVRCYPRKK